MALSALSFRSGGMLKPNRLAQATFIATRDRNSFASLQDKKVISMPVVSAVNDNDGLNSSKTWWKSTLLVEKLGFCRDRLLENFIWTVGSNFEPNFGYLRRVMAKVNALITTIDDVYDIYGTLDDLELFTKAIDRWDLNLMDGLPDYMKACFQTLYNFVDDTAHEYMKKNGHNITSYLKKAWTNLCKTYFIEAKWFYSGYIPSFEEYIENGWISISAPLILVHSYFLVPHTLEKGDLIYLEEYSDIIQSSSMILRLANDLGSYKRENKTGDVAKSIQCYMNETGASEEEACEYIKSMLCVTWKKMNKEAHNSPFSQIFIDTTINLARMALCMYKDGDGHTIQDLEVKNLIQSLIVESIPMINVKK
ncbi:hypothetical protein VNO77_27807 [Canavalia gladiata]|uniref:Terpene synthase metal-binding domain-containing protein n=1 Tax=Canavalia gladiata TaxID=3824 RepID=A0AAN9Q4F8_CANGL